MARYAGALGTGTLGPPNGDTAHDEDGDVLGLPSTPGREGFGVLTLPFA
ncbi:hypothetical protein GCM10022285_43390 [Streptomyces tunisiensis]|uniref:Uncharacterized protein n=1 Tax=Streptomyces tunisiensis TaxID=948699 RepID=A0ABP7YWP2_9ACTN